MQSTEARRYAQKHLKKKQPNTNEKGQARPPDTSKKAKKIKKGRTQHNEDRTRHEKK